MDGTDLARVVSTKEIYSWDCKDPANYYEDPLPSLQVPSTIVEAEPADLHVVAYDFGIKTNILRMLSRQNCKVTVVPAQTSAEDVLALKPDGIFLSNGPGDPEPVTYAQENIRKLLGRKPIFGICLGHQLIGLALGGKTYKLKFGHHGGNHPVQHVHTGEGRDYRAQSQLCGRSLIDQRE